MNETTAHQARPGAGDVMAVIRRLAMPGVAAGLMVGWG